ncbi:helix-turn-helix transcriptional regulator [Novosphingobium sp. PP1Y]|uniref:helix-turn-helix transcriptional regulator n=1 Tax=Novosphingobium sp. PP1Y TaxID=702113 RepID=UPI0002F30810|nr:helix-turn-helix transcriptional regulator [Novosphingobium sp. PP1Y]
MGDDGADPAPRPLDVFPSLTPKQHEVLGYVAENRTSKEIAFELGISVSAVNQRIESIRSRTGSPPRAELARAYRAYLQEQEKAVEPEEEASGSVEPVELLREDDEQQRAPEVGTAKVSVDARAQFPQSQNPERADFSFGDAPSRTLLAKAFIITGGTVVVVLVALGIVVTLHKVF